MRNSKQPTITLEDSNSCYFPESNEIYVMDDDYRQFSLYHEYRHYLQFKYYPNMFNMDGEFRRIGSWLPIFCIFMTNTDIFLNVCYMWLILGVMINITEIDANLFAWNRIRTKGFIPPTQHILTCQGSYIIQFIVSPLFIILLS